MGSKVDCAYYVDCAGIRDGDKALILEVALRNRTVRFLVGVYGVTYKSLCYVTGRRRREIAGLAIG
jgi:hypothetical protein